MINIVLVLVLVLVQFSSVLSYKIETNHLYNYNALRMEATQTYSIFCLAKTGELLEQAHVEEFDETTFNVNLVNVIPSIKHMEYYNTALFHKMVSMILSYPYGETVIATQKYVFAYNEFVMGVIFHRVMMRKGDYFYVLQHSDRGSRVLLYAINRINHSSNSLGASMRAPDVAEQSSSISSELKKFTIKQLDIFQIPYENVKTLIDNINLYFI